MTPKQTAAVSAADLVPNDCLIGLGTGSTADLFVRELGRRIADGRIRGVTGAPTSRRTAELAREVGVPILASDDLPDQIAITFDGADEVDPAWNLTKGGGGSLLREKIVAQTSLELVIIVDDSKLVERLGSSFPVPIDVVPFGWASHLPFLRELGAEPRLRRLTDGGAYRTDEGNFILDLDLRDLGGVQDLAAFEARIRSRVGIVEAGIFLGLTTAVIVGRPDGAERLQRD